MHVEIGPLQGVQRAGEHVVGKDAVLALRQDAVPVLQAVPHLTAPHLVDVLRVEGVAGHDGHLYRAFTVAELGDVVHSREEGDAFHGAGQVVIGLRRLHLADVAGEHLGHLLEGGHLTLLLHQQLDHEHPAGTDGGVHFIKR